MAVPFSWRACGERHSLPRGFDMLLFRANIVSNKSRARIRVGATISIVFLAAGYSLSAFSGSGQVPSVPSQTSSHHNPRRSKAYRQRKLLQLYPVAPTAAAPQRTGLNIVVLDPAHGGTDSGARGTGGIRESEVVLEFATQVAPGFGNAGISSRCKRAMTMKTPRSTTVLQG